MVVVYRLSSLRAFSYGSVPLAFSHFLAVPMYFSDVSLGVTRQTMSFLRKGTGESSPRSTPLYLTKSGPVYSRPPITSNICSRSPPTASSRRFCASIRRLRMSMGINLRMCPRVCSHAGSRRLSPAEGGAGSAAQRSAEQTLR